MDIQTHEQSTVTLAVHVHLGLKIILLAMWSHLASPMCIHGVG